MNNNRHIDIDFGYSRAPLSTQLRRQRLELDDDLRKRLEKEANAIMLLVRHGTMTRTEANAYQSKILSIITKYCRPIRRRRAAS